MKTIQLIIGILLFLNVNAQKITKEFYDYQKTRVKFEYQIDNATGVKNGYYKAYGEKGTLAEQGSYKMNSKNGTWTQYDNYGKPFAITNYTEGKINGVYKQWCFEDYKKVSYLCGDYIYNMGKEEKAITYWPNGKKSKNVVPNGICNQWFENGTKKSEWVNKNGISGEMIYFLVDGRPSVELKNGKTYRYCSDGISSIGTGYDKHGSLKSIEYDSLGFHYVCEYNESVKENFLTLISKIDTINKIVEKTYYYSDGPKKETFVNKDKTVLKKIIYFSNNNVKEEIDLSKKPYSCRNYYLNGQLRQEYFETETGKRVETFKAYFEDGKMKFIVDFSKKEVIEYYETGIVKLEKGINDEGDDCCYLREFDETGKPKQ